MNIDLVICIILIIIINMRVNLFIAMFVAGCFCGCFDGNQYSTNPSATAIKTPELRYIIFCTRGSLDQCGSDSPSTFPSNITTQFQPLTMQGYKYVQNIFCYYEIKMTAFESAVYDSIEFKVDYYFASTLAIVWGLDRNTAINKTVNPLFGKSVFVPTKDNANNPYTIWIISKPDFQNTQLT